jgi:hypothetical protein
VPRLPVDGKKVVEHRISFGTKERELAEGALAAYQFNRVGTPIVAALSDVSFLVFVGGVLAAYKIIDSETWNALTGGALDAANTAEEKINQVLEAGEKAWEVGREKREQLKGLRTLPVDLASSGVDWLDDLITDIRRGFRGRQFIP